MAEVGTDLGTAYRGREGIGQAFRLGESDDSLRALDNLLRLQQQQQAQKAKAKANRQAREDAVRGKMKEIHPDHWHRYGNEVQDMTNKVINLGAELMSSGVEDPFTGYDKGSKTFQKELALLHAMGRNSLQLKDRYNKDTDAYNKDPKKYTLDSGENNMGFYQNPELSLRKITEEGLLPPRLVHAKPQFELAKWYRAQAKALGADNPDPKLSDFGDIINTGLSDPSTTEFKVLMEDRIAGMPEGQLAQLQQQAEAARMTPEQYLGVTELKSYFGSEPINIPQLIDDYMPGFTTNVKVYEGEDFVTSKTKTKKVLDENANKAAEFILESNPKLQQQMIEDGQATNYDTAKTYLTELIKNKAGEEIERSITREGKGYMGSGYSKKKVDDDFEQFYKAISGVYSDDREEAYIAQNIAMQYLNEVKNEDGGTFTSGTQQARGTGNLPFPSGGITDWEPGTIHLNQVGVETRSGVDPETGEKVSKKSPTYSTRTFHFNEDDPNQSGYMGPGVANSYYMEGLTKHQRKLFMDVLEEGISAWRSGGKQKRTQLKGLKSRSKQAEMAKENKESTTPTNKLKSKSKTQTIDDLID